MTFSFGICASCGPDREIYVIDAQHHELLLNNGVLMYKEQPFNGILEDYYSNGLKKVEVMYDDGRKHGVETQWYFDGAIAARRHYFEGKKSGLHKGFWENGNNKFIYQFNNMGAYDGNIKEWYRSGEIMRDFNYVNGKENGSQKMWMQNGSIRANYEVVNGERFGLIGLKKCYQVTTGSDEIK